MHKELNRTWQELNSIWLELPQTCLWFSLANESLELSSVSHGTWNSRRESFHFLSNGSDRQITTEPRFRFATLVPICKMLWKKRVGWFSFISGTKSFNVLVGIVGNFASMNYGENHPNGEFSWIGDAVEDYNYLEWFN